MRPTWFMENWAEQGGSLPEAVRGEGRAYSASGGGRIPWVSRTDIAACAYSALTSEEPPNGDYVILGPELLSYGEVSPAVAARFPVFLGAFTEARGTDWVRSVRISSAKSSERRSFMSTSHRRNWLSTTSKAAV